MGAPASPISPTTQKLERGVSAVADPVLGTATFTFPSPPAGTSWTGTLSCAGAPVSAVFTAAVGATSWGSWGGSSVFGPIQVFGQGSEVLTVTATGLVAGTTYEVFLLGSSDTSVNVAPVWPDTNASALTASITGTASTIITTLGGTIGTGSTTIYNGVLTSTFSGFCVLFAAESTVKTITVRCTNATTGQTITRKAGNTQTIVTGLAQNHVYWFPITVAAGQTLLVTASSTVAFVDSWQIVGYTQPNSILTQQAPNTTAFTGNFGGLYVAATGVMLSSTSTAILPSAPPTGFVYRLHHFGVIPSGTGFGLSPQGVAWLTDTSSVVASVECAAPGGYGGQSLNLGGLLVGSAITANWSGTGNVSGIFVRYDYAPMAQTFTNQ